jgi:CheY-like chemotaxis protein
MSTDSSAPHILVLNSSEALLLLIRDLLTEEGCRVTIGSKVHESSNQVAELQPDLVLVDFLSLSDDSGWKFIQTVRLDPRTKAIPVILCTTGIREARELEPQLRAMNIAVVYKPFDLDDLLRVVGRQLGIPIAESGN